MAADASVAKYISGVILFEETFYQKDSQGTLFPELLKKSNIYTGIKVDKVYPLVHESSESHVDYRVPSTYRAQMQLFLRQQPKGWMTWVHVARSTMRVELGLQNGIIYLYIICIIILFEELAYKSMCRRAVLKINVALRYPTEQAIQENAHGLARYAAICQENGLVPIVEPEVLMDGDHSIEVSPVHSPSIPTP